MKRFGILLVGLLSIFLISGIIYQNNQAQFKETNQIEKTTEEEDRRSTADNETQEALEKTSQKISDNTTEEKLETSEVAQQSGLPKLPQPMPLVETAVINEMGETKNISEFKGKPMVINFWASWCPPCKEEMPVFQEAYDKYGDNIEFIMLNATESRPDETIENAKNYIVQEGFTFPIYFDNEYTNQMMYSVSSLPSTLIINSEGMVEYAIRGPIDEESLIQALEKIK